MVKRVRVLVIDDSAIVRARLVSMIREVHGVVAVDEARDPREALDRAQASLPNIVVLDIHMPGGSGMAILPRLKALASTPIVAVLTNDSDDAHRRECLLIGADFFFDKATEFERVLEIIAEPASVRPMRPQSPRGS
jgi:DNA-binding NarL/FixJ family response regulator